MNNKTVRFSSILLAAFGMLASGACEQIKSANPLSPSIAGPIAGVTIYAPTPVQPAAFRQISDTEQPIGIVIGNAETTGQRPLTMAVQVGSTSDFSVIVFSQTGISPSPDGTTTLRLPDKLQAGRTYYWRTMAEDGANSSGWTDPVQFEVLQPIVIGRPEPVFPIGNLQLTTSAVELKVRNGVSSGPHGPLNYTFQVATNQSFSAMIINSTIDEDGGDHTTFDTPPLAGNQQLYWRVRIDDGPNAGAWSRTESFKSAIIVGPPPTDDGPFEPPSGPFTPKMCASNQGKAITACVQSKFPNLTRPGVSLSQRVANMEYLRDRVIESGICGGLDLARNRKRNGSTLSIDAIAQRIGGRTIVVDIASAYDDTSRTLNLHWLADVGGDPGWQPDIHPDCS